MFATPWPLSKISSLNIRTEFVKILQNEKYDIVLERLYKKKEEVGLLKVKIGDIKWRHIVNKYDEQPVINIPNNLKPVSRAFFKFIEMYKSCQFKNPKSMLALCEAPGGFVQAACYLFKNIKWQAMSLVQENSPYFHKSIEMEDNGEILNLPHNSNILNVEVRNKINTQTKYDLITADGASDNDSHHENLEHHSANILASEIMVALQNQKAGGTFIVKIFGGYQQVTKELIAILCHAYEEVSMIKPKTSRCVNDERYIVCTKFVENDWSHLDLQKESEYVSHVLDYDSIPSEWKDELDQTTKQYAVDQLTFIEKCLSDSHNNKRRR